MHPSRQAGLLGSVMCPLLSQIHMLESKPQPSEWDLGGIGSLQR